MFEMENTNDRSPCLRVVSEGQTVWLSDSQVSDLSDEQLMAVAQYCEVANRIIEGIGDLIENDKEYSDLEVYIDTFGRFLGGE